MVAVGAAEGGGSRARTDARRHRQGAGLSLASFLALAVATTPGLGEARPAHCRAPAEVLTLEAPLPVLCRAIAAGAPVRIVALGSSSTEGAGASSSAHTYPARLEAALRERFPGLDFAVANRGKGGQLLTDMMARLDTDALAGKPTLVILQTGVNDAIRNVDRARFEADLVAGIERIRAAGADLILLDQQYYPKAATVIGYKDFLQIVRQVGARYKVPVFRRYELMAHLVNSAQYKVEDLLSADLFHQNDTSYQCLGSTLADALKASFAASQAQAAQGAQAMTPAPVKAELAGGRADDGPAQLQPTTR